MGHAEVVVAPGVDLALPVGQILGLGEPGGSLFADVGGLGQTVHHAAEQGLGLGLGEALQGVDAQSHEAGDQVVVARPGGALKGAEERLVDLLDRVFLVAFVREETAAEMLHRPGHAGEPAVEIGRQGRDRQGVGRLLDEVRRPLGGSVVAGLQGEIGIEQRLAGEAASERGIPAALSAFERLQGGGDVVDGAQGLRGQVTLQQWFPFFAHGREFCLNSGPGVPRSPYYNEEMRRELPSITLFLLLTAAAGRAEPPKPSALPEGLPEGVTPLSPEGLHHMQTLLEATEKYRGLKAKAPIPAGTLEESGLKKKLLETMRQHMSPESLRAAEVSLKAFGLIPESMKLDRYLPDLLTTQVAGYYDTERKYLAMVRRSGATPSSEGEGSSAEDTVLVHELTHALQDQSFDLEKLQQEDDPLAKLGTALTALAEGDATLTMMNFLSQSSFESLPNAERVMGAMAADPDAMMSALPDLPGANQFAQAPVWLRNLLFGYLQGMTFCISVRTRGGQKLLDYAFATDPPRSTEQVLHPEKWHTHRDDPVAIRLPDLGPDLPGYRKAADGVMGELSVRSLLRQESPGDRGRAAAAAAGWGGDRFAVYEKDGGERLLVWVTDWDSEADAREFRTALAALGHGWRVETAGAQRPLRIVAVRGDLKPEQRRKIGARLAAAPAERPANRDIDLAAIVEHGRTRTNTDEQGRP